jgi:hypothetical protein
MALVMDPKKAAQKRYREKHLEVVRERQRLYHAANPERNRNNFLKRHYGITLEQYKQMIVDQDDKCAICLTDKPGGKGNWHVDHDHDTRVVRGLLCTNCNLGLGNMKDNIQALQNAAVYLARFQNVLGMGHAS